MSFTHMSFQLIFCDEFFVTYVACKISFPFLFWILVVSPLICCLTIALIPFFSVRFEKRFGG